MKLRGKQIVSVISQRYSTQQTSLNPKQPVNIVEFLHKSEWRSVVGLEVHVQISSQSKLFSGARFDFTSPVNSCVSLFDAAIPGTLPSLNHKCVEAAILTSLALNCKINQESRFHRKHYFYSDLPTGYQITQYDQPIAENGQLKFNVFTPGIHKTVYEKSCNLRQVQLEQDSGKTIHDDFENRSLIDLNRAGVALMELVFDPDLSDGEEAAALVKELILILQCVGSSSCKMQEGALRVDANVSVAPRAATELGVRSEVKNIGSIRGVANAVNYEIMRQIGLLQSGGRVVNETRAYDAPTRGTVSMRDKENIQDYRFMPDPNLLPLRVSEPWVSQLRDSLPVLPDQLRLQLKHKYNLNVDFTNRLSRDNHLLALFYSILNARTSRSPRLVAITLVIHLMAVVNQHKLELDDININPASLGDIVDALEQDLISPAVVNTLLETIILVGDPRPVSDIIVQDKLRQVLDKETVTKIVEEYIRENDDDLTRSYTRKSEKKRAKIFADMMRALAVKSRNTLHMATASQVLSEVLEKYRVDTSDKGDEKK